MRLRLKNKFKNDSQKSQKKIEQNFNFYSLNFCLFYISEAIQYICNLKNKIYSNYFK